MRKPKPSAKLLSSVLICLATCATSGCADWGSITGTTAQMCKGWKPIWPSKLDKMTDGTTKQIAGNNAANETWCGTTPVPKETARVAAAPVKPEAKP